MSGISTASSALGVLTRTYVREMMEPVRETEPASGSAKYPTFPSRCHGRKRCCGEPGEWVKAGERWTVQPPQPRPKLVGGRGSEIRDRGPLCRRLALPERLRSAVPSRSRPQAHAGGSEPVPHGCRAHFEVAGQFCDRRPCLVHLRGECELVFGPPERIAAPWQISSRHMAKDGALPDPE